MTERHVYWVDRQQLSDNPIEPLRSQTSLNPATQPLSKMAGWRQLLLLRAAAAVAC
ncbi:MAG: hypothetical protein HC886_01470 [Leptolyngbyaceae cyanobacterium SM1_1_3]|nr:hypothetical protein [Leptolyngbyaceae cyanobacterium SM1_1_3]